MNKQFDAILRALQEEPLATACSRCRHDLYAYADAVVDDHDADARYPAVRSHLAECEACQTAFVELRRLFEMERVGNLAAPPISVQFDFTYLPTAITQPQAERTSRFWRFDELGRLIIQFSADLLQSWQPPALQPAYLKSGQTDSLFETAISEGLDDLSVAIDIRPQRGDPDLLDISVGVDVPSSGGWPHLGGIEVLLKHDDVTIGREWTDAFGQIVFAHVSRADVNDLTFVVTPPDSN